MCLILGVVEAFSFSCRPVKSEVFTAVTIYIVVLWVMASCTLKLEAACSFKTLVATYQSLRCHKIENTVQ
jgi:hypothetical protein